MSELRFFPRISTRLPVTVHTHQHGACAAVISNISPGGVMIVVNAAQKQQITNNSTDAMSAQVVEVEFETSLPVSADGTQVAVSMAGRLVFIRRLSQEEFHLGFRFFSLDDEAATHLQSYVQLRMQGLQPEASPVSAELAQQAKNLKVNEK